MDYEKWQSLLSVPKILALPYPTLRRNFSQIWDKHIRLD